MLKIAIVGDVLMTRGPGEKEYEGFTTLQTFLHSHDIRFANLEMTIHDNEGYPSLFPGGTWVMAHSKIVERLNQFGFNLYAAANNHAMDYSHGGLLATMKHLRENNLAFAGIGADLAEASRAVYIEKDNTKIALISATSSFHDSDAAGYANTMVQGRPGINPLRHQSIYELPPDQYNNLSEILHQSGVNDYHNQAIEEGFLLPNENLKIGYYEFKAGRQNKSYTSPSEADLQRILQEIERAKAQSNVVIVSIHTHQFSGKEKAHPAEFIQITARKCIDQGARIIVCHGPHVVRGIEVYNGGIIFYSLGNFVFENETVPVLPYEFFEKYKVGSSSIEAAFNKRSHNETRGLCVDKKVWESVIASIRLDEDGNRVELHPVKLGFGLPRTLRGNPVLSEDIEILHEIRRMSLPYETNISIKNQIGIVHF